MDSDSSGSLPTAGAAQQAVSPHALRTTQPLPVGRHGQPRRGTPRPHRGLRRLLPSWKTVLLGLTLLVCLGVAGVAAAFALVSVPDPKAQTAAQVTTIYFSDGRTPVGTFGVNRTNVPLSRVPVHVQRAVLAAEDRTFYENNGVAPKAIARAAVSNLRGDSVKGASTITQQYVKNVYLSSERTYSRKAQEFVLAIKLDSRLSKDELLENYLNTIYWGRGAYGVAAASQAYFGKDVSKLSVAEGAYLAGIIQSPGRYDAAANRGAALQRWDYVLDGMVEKGWLAARDRGRLRFPNVLSAKKEQRLAGPAGYLLTTVRGELLAQGIDEQLIDAGGLRVVTTFDAKAQAAAEKAMKEGFPKRKNTGVHAGLAAVRPGDGGVVAMYGGPDYLKRSGINDAITTQKSAGSTFKAFALASALEEDIGLRSRWDGNSPLTPQERSGLPKPVKNEFNRSYGEVELGEATEKSINTAYVDLTLEIGPERVVEAVRKAGLDKDRVQALDPVPTVALGTAGVAPVDLANAYGTFAALGRRSSWYTVTQVKGSDGTTRFQAAPRTERAFEEDVVADVSAALQRVVQRGTGTAARKLNRPVAGKTGTHQDKTAWFVGYTPQLAAAVSFYKEAPDGTELSLDGVGGERTFFGGRYPARIWTDFMAGALPEKIEDFPPPSDIGAVQEPPSATPSPSASATPSSASPSPTPSPSASSGSPSPSVSVIPSPSPTRSAPPSRTPLPSVTPRPSLTLPSPPGRLPSRTPSTSSTPVVTPTRRPSPGSSSPAASSAAKVRFGTVAAYPAFS